VTNWTRGLAAMLVLAAVAALPLGCSKKIDPRLTGLPGYPVYRKYCKRCHGADGAGGKASRVAGRAVDLAAPGFRDTTTVESLERVIGRGKGKMKGYDEKLSPSQIEATARFVRALSLPDVRPK